MVQLELKKQRRAGRKKANTKTWIQFKNNGVKKALGRDTHALGKRARVGIPHEG